VVHRLVNQLEISIFARVNPLPTVCFSIGLPENLCQRSDILLNKFTVFLQMPWEKVEKLLKVLSFKEKNFNPLVTAL
jgi:hypothetical protein